MMTRSYVFIFSVVTTVIVMGILPKRASGQQQKGPSAEQGARPIGIKELTVRPEVMADEKLEAAIATLNQLIESTDEDDPSKPEYLARLAGVYWDKADSFMAKAQSDEMYIRLRAAQDAGNDAEVARIEAEQKALMQQCDYWRGQAVKVYERIVNGYPEYPALDEVLYNLGFSLVQMDRAADAYPYFARIIRETPTSRYVPEALLNIAEYFFNIGRMDEALRVYSEVENFPASSAYGLAIYKKGWCLYNMGLHEEAMNQFLRVIEYAKSEAGKAVGYGQRLLVEAQRNLVRVYTQIGSPEKAIEVFRKIAPDNYLELAIRLADAYTQQGEFEKSTRLYRRIIGEFKDREDAYRIIAFQGAIFENAVRQGVPAKIAEEARRLFGLMDRYLASAPDSFKKSVLPTLDKLVYETAENLHREVEKTKDERTAHVVELLYREHVRLFPSSAQHERALLNYAATLASLGEYEQAADAFMQVLEAQPEDEIAQKAAHGAMSNYYKLFDIKSTKIKAEDTADNEPKELPDLERKLVAACKKYIAIAKPDAPELVEARLAAAIVYYTYNHFQEAVTLFREVLQIAPDHPNAPDAARLLLSSLHLMRDIKGLNAAAEQISRDPRLMKGDVPTIVARIREQADFNRCYEFEQQERYRVAAECFLDYVKKFPQTPLKDRALINAANNFFKARLVERSLEANLQLFNEMPKSPLAPRALFNIAETYRRLAVYSEAARFYETFVRLLPKHELTEEALRYAILFRSGLGEYSQAVANMNQYLKLFPESQYAANVFFEIGNALSKQGNHAQALKQFQAFLTKYGKTRGLDLYFKALLRIAQTYKALKNETEANKAFDRVVAEYNALPDEEKAKFTADGLAAVAEARFMQGEAVLARVRAIPIRGNLDAIGKAIKQKAEILMQAMGIFASVEAFGQPHWTIAALSRKGFGFQELALAIEAVPPPPGFNEDQKQAFRDGLVDRSRQFWEKAKEEFLRCIEVAKSLKWFNEYSEQAEEALMKIEPGFRSLPDIRPMPVFYTLNSGKPRLLPMKEGEESPKWREPGLFERIKAAAEKADAGAAAMYNYGAVLEATGDLDGAARWYERALTADPKLGDALGRLGMVELAKGNEAKAKAYFERALEIDPANSIVNNVLAARELRAGHYPEALSHARKALVSDPDSMDAYLNLAAAYFEMGLLDVGILVGRNALGLDKDDASIQNMLGLILTKRGEIRHAVALFSDAIEDDPNLVDARMNLGAMMLAYKDFESALKQFSAVLEIRPGFVSARVGLAVAYRGMDKPEDALRILNELMRERPDFADPHFNACLVYQENLNQYEKALQECETFARMADASHPKRKEVERRIEGLKMVIQATSASQ